MKFSRRQRPQIRLSVISVLLASTWAVAAPAFGQSGLPQGGQVVHGQVSIEQAGSGLVIRQASPKAIVNWADFSIGAGTGGVRFIQPDGAAAILNRVTGQAPSVIAGSLTGNGHVYLVNPNGIAITEHGHIDVSGGFIASTLNVSDRDFLAGRLTFEGSSGLVRNDGHITVGAGGYVALLGGQVAQHGTVSVPLGRIGLGAGQRATLDVCGDGFLQVALAPGAVHADTALTAGGAMSAQRIEVRVQTVREAMRQVVNVPGELVAKGAHQEGGTIVIDGGEGAVRVSGTLDASSTSAVGGQVRLGGKNLWLDGARIDASGTQGGVVSIGGGVRGATVEGMTTATQLHVDAGTSIRANGSVHGGGEITLWSDQDTRFQGLIQARGQQGDGGDAEVSSHGLYDYSGHADLLSAQGRAGTLLLDPYNVTISTGTTTGMTGYTASGTGATINVASLQASLGSASVVVSTGASGAEAGDITLSSALSWSANTTLTLSAAGQIKVNANITNSGTGSGVNLTAGGTGGIIGTGGIANAGALTLNPTNASATGALSGVISGAGTVTKTGAGSVTLSGANTYSGGTTISAGALAIGNTDTLGSANSSVAIGAAGTLNINVTSGSNINYTHAWSGAGTLVYNVTDTAQSNYLTGNGTGFTGQFNITGVSGGKAGISTLDFSNAAVKISNSVAAIVNNGMTVQFGSLSGTAGTVRSGGNSGLSTSSVLVVGNLNTSTTYSGAISILSNAMSLQKVGSGTLTLGGNNNYTGTTTVNGGTLKANSATAFGNNSAVTVANGATLDLAGRNNSIGSLAGDGVVTNTGAGASVLTVGGANTSTTFTGVLRENGGVLSLAKTGSGTLTVSGANTYTGTTTVSAGTFKAGSATAFSSSSALALSGTGKLDVAGNAVSVGSLAGTAGTVQNSSASAGSLTTGALGTSTTYSGVIQNGTGTLSLSKAGAGAFTLAGTNTYTGTTAVNAGTLNLSGSLNVGSGNTVAYVAGTAQLTGSGTLTAGTVQFSGSGSVNLSGSNQVNGLTSSGSVGSLTFNNGQSLSVQSISASGPVVLTASGASADLTLASGALVSSSASGNAVVLSAGRNFINNAGASAVSTPAGRWLIYSATPGSATFGGLDSGNTALWNVTSASMPSGSVSQSGHRYLFGYQPTVTFTSTSLSKTYGQDATSAVASSYAVSGLQSAVPGAFVADSALQAFTGAPAVTSPGSGTSATVAGGPYTLSVAQGSLQALSGYALGYAPSGQLTVNRALLTVTAQDLSQTYNGQAYAGGNGVTYTGLMNGETGAVLGGSLAYGGSSQGAVNAGAYAITASGLTSNNYSLSYVPGTLTIGKAPLTLSTSDVQKTYDGTTTAAGSVVVSAGTLYTNASNGGTQDTVSGGNFAFTDRNAGAGKTVTVSGATVSDGNGGGNYDVSYAVNTTSSIGKATLTVSSTDVSKTYDGTLSALGVATAVSGLVAGDTLSGGTFAFTNANAGTGKTVTVSGVTINDGNNGQNYQPVVYQANTSSTISKASLTLSTSDVQKTYDGTTAAAGSVVVSAGTLYANASNGGTQDTVSGGSFAFTDRNAGPGKTVTVSGATVSDGNGGGNYDVSYAVNTTSSIGKATLTVSSTDVSKPYDGQPVANGKAVALSGLGVGDWLSGGTFAFTDASAGTGKTVMVQGVTVNDGNDGANYLPLVYRANTQSIIFGARPSPSLAPPPMLFPSEITLVPVVPLTRFRPRQADADAVPGLIAMPRVVAPVVGREDEPKQVGEPRPGSEACLPGRIGTACESMGP